MNILRLLISAGRLMRKQLDSFYTRLLFMAYDVRYISFRTSGIPKLFTPKEKTPGGYIQGNRIKIWL